jgi:putative phosphoesterase
MCHMRHRIGIISDTHIPNFPALPEALWQHFEGVSLILHAGDLSQLSVIRELETIAPVTAVQGNVERMDVVMKLPVKREVQVGFCRIGLIHILASTGDHARLYARMEFPNARVVVYGHTHRPYNHDYGDVLLFNPGSATDRRHEPTCSIGLLTIDDEAHSVHGEIIPLPD